ncbi:MAG: endonuclease Q family protein [Chloroflexi bacterium]|nr:endonuclease Q family protein [Chloroflexota bacterium]
MSYAVDLHVHSRYAYATSKDLEFDSLARQAKIKGIDLLASADFTYPDWFEESRLKLNDAGNGLFEYGGVTFILGTEVECHGKHDGRGRRVHLLVFAPSLETVERINSALSRYGKLDGDGRPALGLLPRELLTLIKSIDERCFLIPAHLWTPWFGLYGSKSGYDSLEECFGSDVGQIPAIETGLSSDPAMNWTVPSLDNLAIMSFSDAHSAPNLGRELTVVNGEMTYDGLVQAMRRQDILYTVEFYPEEGKYHHSGHRACLVKMSPEDVRKKGEDCRSCGRRITVGVSYRVKELGGRHVDTWVGDDGLVHGDTGRPPFKSMVPLREVLSESLGVGVGTKTVARMYERLIEALGTELTVLMDAPIAEIESVSNERTAEGIDRVRRGDIFIEPGYDGVYGEVRVWGKKREGARRYAT